jgi:hypothetical protein
VCACARDCALGQADSNGIVRPCLERGGLEKRISRGEGDGRAILAHSRSNHVTPYTHKTAGCHAERAHTNHTKAHAVHAHTHCIYRLGRASRLLATGPNQLWASFGESGTRITLNKTFKTSTMSQWGYIIVDSTTGMPYLSSLGDRKSVGCFSGPACRVYSSVCAC